MEKLNERQRKIAVDFCFRYGKDDIVNGSKLMNVNASGFIRPALDGLCQEDDVDDITDAVLRNYDLDNYTLDMSAEDMEKVAREVIAASKDCTNRYHQVITTLSINMILSMFHQYTERQLWFVITDTLEVNNIAVMDSGRVICDHNVYNIDSIFLA